MVVNQFNVPPTGVTKDQYDEIEDVATTNSFVTALNIDVRDIRTSVFVIHNVTAGDLDYQILGNVRDDPLIVDPTGTNDDDEGWVILKASTSISSGATPVIETLTNPHTRIIVQIKHTTATTNASIWHRGEN